MEKESKFQDLVDAIHSLHEMAKPFVEQNNKDVQRIITKKITNRDYLDKMMDQSLELCYSSQDHSGYLQLIEYIRTFDKDFADEHYKFYYDWFLNTDIDDNE